MFCVINNQVINIIGVHLRMNLFVLLVQNLLIMRKSELKDINIKMP